jgi:streptogrisin D
VSTQTRRTLAVLAAGAVVALGSVVSGFAPAEAGQTNPANPANQASAAAIQGALDALPPTPDTAWGPAASGGREVLTISTAAPAAGVRRLLAVAARFGDRVLVRRTTRPLTEQVLGGAGITDGQFVCSAGFNVIRNSRMYVLTAGHCTQGLPYWQDLGPSVASNFPGTDFGLVRNDSWDGPGAVDRYDGNVVPITSAGVAAVGEHVCASGHTTGLTCGSVVALNQTVTFSDGTVVHGLIQTNVHTDHGDSGGPLFDGTVGLGTVSGGDGQTDYFQPLAPELATYGVNLAPAMDVSQHAAA